jgi:hypothetical protein
MMSKKAKNNPFLKITIMNDLYIMISQKSNLFNCKLMFFNVNDLKNSTFALCF